MSGGSSPERVDRASPVDDDALAAPPPAKSDLSDVDKTTIQSGPLPPARKGLFPRPPGIFPDNYPPNRTLSRVPTPGEPLAPPDRDPAFRIIAPRKPKRNPAKVEAVPSQRLACALQPQPAKTEVARCKTIAKIELVNILPDFPAIDAGPPKFKAKVLEYPSGNPTGTSDYPPFADKLRELLLCGISQTKYLCKLGRNHFEFGKPKSRIRNPPW
jgi:hypothetical protein